MNGQNGVTCLRCQEPLDYKGAHKLVYDDFALIRPSTMLDLYSCPKCGHIEMFDRDVAAANDGEHAIG
jgi:hypothetical protein